MSKINGCPYKASCSGQCTHRITKVNRKGKRYCGYEFPHNCDLFMEWLEIKQSISRMAKNSSDRYIYEGM